MRAPERSEIHDMIHGTGLSLGTARGAAMQFDARSAIGLADSLEPNTVPVDAVARFERALSATITQIDEIIEHGASRFADVVKLIFTAHRMMLEDPAYAGEIRKRISNGESPEKATATVTDELSESLSANHNERIAEKGEDIRDLGRRVLSNLTETANEGTFAHGRVVVLKSVFPSELLRLAIDGAAGIVLVGTTVTAHIGILARSLGVPVLSTTSDLALAIPDGSEVVLDATRGVLYPTADAAPPDTTVASSEGDAVEDRVESALAVSILANVNILADAYTARRYADGIGLYRSEFPFIIRKGFLSEDEQKDLYSYIIGSMPGKPITLRTADIGGDKLLDDDAAESNPFLGVRGIRFSLANREAFRTQLRAMLRAGIDTDLGIMFPMVSTVEEVQEAKDELVRCIEQLARDGIPHNGSPRVGAMIELPSAAIATSELAAETDFLSIGTNDLVMYMLAVDRTNARVADLYRTHHPTILRTIHWITARVGGAIGELSVCGEAAADPLMIPFFLGLGIKKLSGAPRRLRDMRRYVTALDERWCRDTARSMLAIRTIHEMDEYLVELESQLHELNDRVTDATSAAGGST